MKLFLMHKVHGVPVMMGVFNDQEEIDEFLKNYWGNPNKDWKIIEVSDKDFSDKFALAIDGNLNID